jgi:hypothetical protein
MSTIKHRFFDINTGDELYASDDFAFASMPEINHRLHDPDLVDRFGGPAIIHRIEELPIKDINADEIELLVYLDGE